MISSEQQKNIQARINTYATQYGNKAANLIELSRVCKRISNKKIKIVIPAIFPLSDELIKSHLNKHLPDWVNQWQSFVKAQGKNKSLTPIAIERLKTLRQNILICFKDHPLNFKAITKRKHAADTLFMVRSTGEEDTVDIANPGGNESVAAVKADNESISSAIGVVVASYLSEKSLMQRLLSGDLITKTPFMPVVLQTMIGEPLKGETNPKKVVISGVMYADQNMTRMDVAPGHGELIVNSKAPFDTYDVSKKGIVYPEIHHKAARLVPVEIKQEDGTIKRKLHFKDNPKVLQSAPALSPRIAKSIARIGQFIKQHYGIPMDIEWVYQPWNKTLYIVQTRPIPAGVKHKIKPSTLSSFASAELQKYPTTVISAGGNAAQVVTEKEQLLMSTGIGDALQTYLNKTSIQAKTKVVLVKNPSPSTSHEAAQFNALGIPVMQIDTDYDQIAAELKEKSTVYVVDPQRQQIVNISTKVKNKKYAEKELKENKMLVEGLFSSSLSPKLTSLPTVGIPASHADVIKQYLKKPIKRTSQPYQHLLSSLQIIEAAQPGEKNKAAFKALAMIASTFRQLATSSMGKQKETPHQKIFTYAMLAIADLHLYLKQYRKNQFQKDLLDLVSKLKALVINPGGKDLYSDSIVQIATDNKIIKDSPLINDKEISSIARPYMIEFLRLNQIALNEKTKTAWTQFVIDCCKTAMRCQALAKIIKEIGRYQLQSEFINQIFVRLAKDETDNALILVRLAKEISANVEDYQQYEFEKNAQVIQSWEARYQEWADPAKFEHLIVEFESDVNVLMKKLVLTPSMTISVRNLIIKQAQALTEMMDRTIKSLKGSPDYATTKSLIGLEYYIKYFTNNSLRKPASKLNTFCLMLLTSLKAMTNSKDQSALLVQRFVKLLAIYLRLMNQWMEAIPASQYNHWAENFDNSYTNTKKNMIDLINRLFRQISLKMDAAQLHPSDCFSVESARVGTTANLERQVEAIEDQLTAEDLFTWMHQNILASTAYLAKDSQIGKEHLPEQLQPLLNTLEQVIESCDFRVTPEIMGIFHEQVIVKVEYNIPLRNHSAKLNLEYNTVTKELIIHVYFFGHNGSKRMDKIVNAAKLERLLFGAETIKEAEYNLASHALGFSWRFKEYQIPQLTKHINKLLEQYVRLSNYDRIQDTYDPETVVLKRHMDQEQPIVITDAIRTLLWKSDTFTPKDLFPDHDDLLENIYPGALFRKFLIRVNINIVERIYSGTLSFAGLKKLIQKYNINLNLNSKSSRNNYSLVTAMLNAYTGDQCLEILNQYPTSITLSTYDWQLLSVLNNEKLNLQILKQATTPLNISTAIFYKMLLIPEALPILKVKIPKESYRVFVNHRDVCNYLETFATLKILTSEFGYIPNVNTYHGNILVAKTCRVSSAAEIKEYLDRYKPNLKDQQKLYTLCKGDVEIAHAMLQLGAPLDLESILAFRDHPLIKADIEKKLESLDGTQLTQMVHESLYRHDNLQVYTADSSKGLITLIKILEDQHISLDFNYPDVEELRLFDLIISNFSSKDAKLLLKTGQSKFFISHNLFMQKLESDIEFASVLLNLSEDLPILTPSQLLKVSQTQCNTILEKFPIEKIERILTQDNVYFNLKELGFEGLDTLIEKFKFKLDIDNKFIGLLNDFSDDDIVAFLKKYHPNLRKQSNAIDRAVKGNNLILANLMLDLGAPLTARSISAFLKNPDLTSRMDTLMAKISNDEFAILLVKSIDDLSNDELAILLKRYQDKLNFNQQSSHVNYKRLAIEILLKLSVSAAIEFINKYKSSLIVDQTLLRIVFYRKFDPLISTVVTLALPNPPLNYEQIIYMLRTPLLKPLLDQCNKTFLAKICDEYCSSEMFSSIDYNDLKNLITTFDYKPNLNTIVYHEYKFKDERITLFIFMLWHFSADHLIDFLNTFKPDLSKQNLAVAEALKLFNPTLLKLILDLGAPVSLDVIETRTGDPMLDSVIQSHLSDRTRFTQILHSDHNALYSPDKILHLVDIYYNKVDLSHLNSASDDIRHLDDVDQHVAYQLGSQSLMSDLIRRCDPENIVLFLKKHTPDLSKCVGVIKAAADTHEPELLALVAKLSSSEKDKSSTATVQQVLQTRQTADKTTVSNVDDTAFGFFIGFLKRPFATFSKEQEQKLAVVKKSL